MLSLGFIRGVCVLGGALVLSGCEKDGDLGKDSEGQASDDGSMTTADDDGACDAPEACGPAPGAPNYLCEDGVTVGGPGPCELQADGTCGWTFIDCPPADTGSGGGESGGASDSGGVDCDCRLGAYFPVCGVDGMTYDATCGIECVPVEIECMGSECPCPGQDTGGSGSSGGDVCSDQGESCAMGEACCEGLECCAGVPVPEGQEFCGATCPISDRNKKENFELVDTHAILDKVATLPITTWNYKAEDPSVRHIGPMAQDFKATFRVGATDKSIFVVDADGVALASIQALADELRQAQRDNEDLRAQVDALATRLSALESTSR